MRMRSKHSRRTVRIQRSANAFATGARTGDLMMAICSEPKIVSNAASNLLSRSRIAVADQVHGEEVDPEELLGAGRSRAYSTRRSLRALPVGLAVMTLATPRRAEPSVGPRGA